jgi:hypothetical protein
MFIKVTGMNIIRIFMLLNFPLNLYDKIMWDLMFSWEQKLRLMI